MSVVGMLTIIAVAGALMIWSQSSKGPMGDPGPPGPKGPQGDAGPPSTTSDIRIVRSNCDETTCRVQCGENEMLLTAYCGPIRNLAIILTERYGTYRKPMPVNSPLGDVWALMANPWRRQRSSPGIEHRLWPARNSAREKRTIRVPR